MSELLAPAGNFESAIAAISNGADAIYVGLQNFSARAYSDNFSLLELEQLANYAHLRNVKVYVAINTIIFEEELPLVYETIKQLYLLGVDALIIQDLAVLKYVIDHFPQMEAHSSTQMGIDDLEGIKFLEELGVKQIVLARELSIKKIKYLKTNTNVKLESFIHGALCVSYSGNCLMSGLIGFRSGNRGRCVGSCRKKYQLVNITTNTSYPKGYLLSMKDLNTTNQIEELAILDSLKIEGRMKEPAYVANVVKNYRLLLDQPTSENKQKVNTQLSKTFQRTFTKGYIFNEKVDDIANIEKPNNYGFLIGKITKRINQYYEITLFEPLHQGDQIRIATKNEVNLPIVKLYDENYNLISSSTITTNNQVYLEMKEKIPLGSLVYKTKDCQFLEELNQTYPKEYRRLPLNFEISGQVGKHAILKACYNNLIEAIVESNELISQSINKPLTYENIEKQLIKLNDTPYYLNSLVVNLENNCFLPVSILNDLRRNVIEKINQQRTITNRQLPIINKQTPLTFENQFEQKLAVEVTTEEQYRAALKAGITTIYYENIVGRNCANYQINAPYTLVGGYGSLHYFKAIKTRIITDYSFNVVNSDTLYHLFKLGVKRVTLSHELNKTQIQNLIDGFKQKNKGLLPETELIVYGRQPLMFTKYCALKHLKLCGDCMNFDFVLKDGLAAFPLAFDGNCHMTIYNSKILNLIDNFHQLSNINYLRLKFTNETAKETSDIIKMWQKRLEGSDLTTKYFNESLNTRGHFNRRIL